jgi:hypothetical protein
MTVIPVLPALQADITLASFNTYIVALATHDWFYDYADDHRVWRAGNAKAKHLKDQAKTHPLYQQAYDCFVAFMFRDKATDQAAFEIARKQKDDVINNLRNQIPNQERKAA